MFSSFIRIFFDGGHFLKLCCILGWPFEFRDLFHICGNFLPQFIFVIPHHPFLLVLSYLSHSSPQMLHLLVIISNFLSFFLIFHLCHLNGFLKSFNASINFLLIWNNLFEYVRAFIAYLFFILHRLLYLIFKHDIFLMILKYNFFFSFLLSSVCPVLLLLFLFFCYLSFLMESFLKYLDILGCSFISKK